MLSETFHDEYVRIAKKAQAGEFIDADLEPLTKQIEAKLIEANPHDWTSDVRALQARVREIGQAIVGPASPLDTLGTMEGRRMSAFVCGAVVRLDEVLERIEGVKR